MLLQFFVAAGFVAQIAHANPAGPVVANGRATFETRGNLLSVTNTPGAIINWQQFSIRADETTRFIQPSAASSVLSRVVGADPSSILGALQSNGRVVLINPNGIVFGAGARIEVGGMVASTLNLSNPDFLAGRMIFTGDPARAAAVVNQGRIAARDGGRVFLVGSAVDNQGVVTAPNGDIVLAAGGSVRVTESAAPGVQVEITAPADRAMNLSELAYGPQSVYAGLVGNRGVISADSAVRGPGGSVTLKASHGVTLATGSRVSADGRDGGRIVIDAQQGAAAVSGSVSATGAGGRGGSISIAGERAGLLGSARVDASGAGAGGNVLIGGDLHGEAIRDGQLGLANARRTFVAPAAQILADARASGDGGNVVVWADDSALFYGSISARGGANGGNGGRVEVSGKETLVFRGKVDTRAPMGMTGTLLLDPTNITVSGGIGDGNDVDALSNSFFGGPAGTPGRVLSTDGTPTTLFQSELEGIAATTNISLAATSAITIGPLAGNNLDLKQTGGNSVLFQSATFSMNAGDTITAAGGSLGITTTGGATIGSLATNGGAVTLDVGAASTVAGSISGTSTSLVKQGGGRLTLNGASTYTGATTVSAGTLALGASGALPSATAVTVNGGTLDVAGADQTVAGVHLLSGSIAGTSGVLTSTTAYDLQSGTVSAILGGTVGVDKTTGATVTLSGANTYTGLTAVSSGVLNLRNATASGTTAGGVTVANGAALELQGGIAIGNQTLSLAGTGIGGNGALRNISGNNAWGGSVTLAGAATIQSDANTLTLNSANAVTGAENLTLTGAGNGVISGTITTGAGTLTKSGAGTWTLSGANTYTGATTVTAGTLALGASNVLADAGSLVVNGGTIDIAGNSETVQGVQLLSGTIAGNGGTLTSTTPYDLQQGTVSALLGGAVGVNKTGAGLVTLSGANTYSGLTAVNQGTLAVTVNNALGATAAGTTVAGGATLDLQNVAYNALEPVTLNGGTLAASTGTSSFANAVILGANSTASVDGTRLTLNGTVGDSGSGFSLTKTGAGTLAMGASNLLANTISLVLNGGTLDFATFSDTVAGVQLAGGSITGSGTLTSSSDFDLQAGSASVVLAGATGAIGATKTTGGTVTLSAANTYTGVTTINAGVLSVSSLANGGLASGIGQSSNAAANLVLGGGSLQYTGGTTSIDRNYTLIGGTTGSLDVSPGATNLTLTGASTATNGSLTKLGSGTLTLSAAQPYTGTTTVSAGTLTLGASERLDDASHLVVNGTGNFNLAGFNETVAAVQLLGGSITGAPGTLFSISDFDLQAGSASAILNGTTGTIGAIKSGPGTVTLSGANTYGGATTINAGVLSVSSLANGGLVSNIGRSSNAAANLVLGGGTLQYTGATKSIDRNFTLTNGTTSSIDVVPGTNLTLLGASTATSGGLTKLGAGTLTLNGNNLHTGTTTVSAGTLAESTNDALASGDVTVSGAGAKFDIGTFTDTVGVVTLVDGSIAGTTGILTGTAFEVQNGSISAILAGTGVPLTKTTGGTVTLSGNNTYTGLTTVSAGTLLLGASDRLDDATHLVVNGTGTFDIAGFNETVAGVLLDSASGVITGTSGVLTSSTDFDLRAGTVNAILTGPPGVGVIKSSPGTVTLSRQNTYPGVTTVNAGTLSVNSIANVGGGASALGAPTTVANGTIELGAGTLQYTGAGHSSDRVIHLIGAGTVDASGSGTLTLSGGVIGDTQNLTLTGTGAAVETGVIATTTGTLTKNGVGTWTLSGANTYTGATNINGGILRISADGNLGAAPGAATPNQLTFNGGTLNTTASFTLDANRGATFNAGGATVDTSAGTTLTYDGSAAGVGALTKIDAGTLVLGGASTYAGATNINGGTLQISADNNLGAAPGAATPGQLTINGATLNTTASFTLNANRGATFNAASATIDANSGTTLTYGGIAAGTGNLTKTDGGRLVLGGANTYTGVTNVNGGTLQISADNNLGAAPGVATPGKLTINGGTVNTTASFTLNANRGASFNAGGATIDTNPGTTLTYGGIAAGAGNLTKIDAGRLVLGGANIYTGATSINGGILQISADNNLGTAPGVATPGRLTFDGGTLNTTASFALNASRGAAFNAGGATIDTNPGTTLTYGGIAAGTGALTKIDTGRLVLGGASTYSGATNINGGILQISADNNLGAAPGAATPSQLTFGGGTLNTTTSFTLDANRGATFNAGGATIDTNAATTLTYDGIAAGAGALTKIDAGTLVLGGANTYTGATNINGGALQISADNNLGAPPGVATPSQLTINGATLNTTASFALDANRGVTFNAGGATVGTGAGTTLTYGGIAAGTGTLTKTNSGTLVLGGADTYTGTTTVNGGTLRLAGGSAIVDTGAVVLANSAGVTLDLTASETIGNISGGGAAGGNVTLNANTLTTGDAGNTSFGGMISGAGGLIKQGGGTFTLTGTNTYDGATAVNAGTLAAAANAALGSTAGGTTVANGATLSIVNAAIPAEAVTLNGAGVGTNGALTGSGTTSLAGMVTLATASTIGAASAADALTVSGLVEGPGGLSLVGAGTTTFANTVGATAALASLTQNAATRLHLDGGLVRSSGNQTYNGPVVTGGATTLRTTADGDVAGNGAFTATAGSLTFDTGAGNASLVNFANDFGTVQATRAGAVTIVDANGITIGTANLKSLGVLARAGNVTLAGNVTATGTGDTIVLVANGNFINNAGANALDPGPGRFLVYSTNPASDTRGGLAYDFKQYRAPFGVTPAETTGNGFLYVVAPTITQSLTDTATKVYDGTDVATLNVGNYAFTGVIDGDTIALSNASSGTYDTRHVGTGKLVSVAGLSLAGASNGAARVYGYQDASTTASGNIGVITPAALTVTADSRSKTYGESVTFAGSEFSSAGLQNGETLTGVALASAGAPATAHVAGPYPIVASAASGGTFTPGDYNIGYVNGALTVNQRPLAITADSQVKAYGSPVTFTGGEFTVSGLQNSETVGRVTLISAGASPTAPVTAPTAPGVTPYPIIASAATGGTFIPGDYAVSYVNGALTVNPAGLALKLTANDQTKAYGRTLVFAGTEFTATGLQNGETIGQVALSSAGAAATAHVAGSPYPITISGGTGGTFSPGNYTITYVDGKLTVTPVPLTITADDKSRIPGLPNPPFSATYSGFKLNETPQVLTGTLRFNTPATTASPPGIFPIVPSGQTSSDYTIAYVDGKLSVLAQGLLVIFLPGVAEPLVVDPRRFGVDLLASEIADCLGQGTGAPGGDPKGVAVRSRKGCGLAAAGRGAR